MTTVNFPARFIPCNLNYEAFVVQTHTPSLFNSDKKMQYKQLECFICKSKNNIHQHHIVPISKFGAHSKNNICLLCASCHIKVENGTISIPLQGKINYRLKRKTNKILRKCYNTQKNDISLIFFTQKFINKHLDLNLKIKLCIKYGKLDRVEELLKNIKGEL